MVRVLLINPSLTLAKDDVTNANPVLGLAYLAGVLRENGIKVAILDALGLGIKNVSYFDDKKRVGLSDREIISYIKKFKPNIVGIGCSYTAHCEDSHRMASLTKKVSRKIIVVFGGSHASSNPKMVLSDSNVDIIVRGEGEFTLLEIVRNYEMGKSINKISGTIVREKKEKLRENPPRPYIKNLDELPFPARDLLPMEAYTKERESEFHNTRFPLTTMITSRGCPGNCIYCAVKTIWGRVWRGRSPENVVAEIEELINKFGVREIHFLDDSMSVDRDRLEGICDLIIEKGLDFKWATPNGIALWLLNKPLLNKMKKAGCYRVTFGLESGNKKTLEIIGKKYSYSWAKDIIKHAYKIGLWTIGTFIIGFPEEKIGSIKDTINFAVDSDLDLAVFYSATPFPGTALFDYFVKEGLIYKNDASQFIGGCDTKYFTAKELSSIREKAYNKFIFSRMIRPWRLFKKIRNFEDLLYLVSLIKIFFKWFNSRLKPRHFSTAVLTAKS